MWVEDMRQQEQGNTWLEHKRQRELEATAKIGTCDK